MEEYFLPVSAALDAPERSGSFCDGTTFSYLILCASNSSRRLNHYGGEATLLEPERLTPSIDNLQRKLTYLTVKHVSRSGTLSRAVRRKWRCLSGIFAFNWFNDIRRLLKYPPQIEISAILIPQYPLTNTTVQTTAVFSPAFIPSWCHVPPVYCYRYIPTQKEIKLVRIRSSAPDAVRCE